MIDELIGHLAATTGQPPARVRTVLAAALGLLDRHGAPDRLRALYAGVPGAEALARGPEATRPRGGGLFGGVLRSAGGLSGRAMADAMAVLGALDRQGVGKAELKALLPPAEAWIRERTGRDLLREAVESVTGVGTVLAGR